MEQLTEHQKILAEWCPPSTAMNHADKLPQENPLRNFPYWGSNDGKNLSVLDALQWAMVHLEHCDKELPCKESKEATLYLNCAMKLLQLRQDLRKQQGVLGTNKPHKS